jgi:hypothetical protein
MCSLLSVYVFFVECLCVLRECSCVLCECLCVLCARCCLLSSSRVGVGYCARATPCRYGLVIFDWAHAAEYWINEFTPMDNGAGLAKQCEVGGLRIRSCSGRAQSALKRAAIDISRTHSHKLARTHTPSSLTRVLCTLTLTRRRWPRRSSKRCTRTSSALSTATP